MAASAASNYKLFATLIEASFVAFTLILLGGLYTTPRVGIPTISRMINDVLPLAACLGAAILLYGIAISILTYLHMRESWIQSDIEVRWHDFLIAISGLLQLTFLIEVCIISIDSNQTGHYVVAGGAVICSVLRESFLASRRLKLYGPNFAWSRSRIRAMFYIINVFIIATLVACFIAYIVVGATNAHNFTTLTLGPLEYQIFFCVIVLPVFQIMDLGEQEELCAKAKCTP